MKNLFTLTFWVSIIASFSSLAQTPDINVKYFSTTLSTNLPPSTNNGTSFGLTPLNNVTLTTEFTIENRGTGTLTISSIDVIGTAASDFTVTNSPSTTLAPNATTTLRITFNPSVADRRNATVSIGSNDPDESPFRINLLGTGIEPEIDVVGNGYSIANGSSTPITNNHTHFGAEFVTGGSIVRTFTIDNNDLAPLNLTGTPTKVAITGTHASDFTLTAAPPSSVARFESTTFQITFNPSGNGVRTALVTIANDDEDENPYTFAIEGVGTDPSSSADYTISTANSTITITDVNGNGETMEVSESSSNVRFFVSGRTYSIDGGPVTPFTTPADISISGKTGIVVNTNGGNDIISVGAFTSALPGLTINAGVGDDIVNMNGNITFAANANLDLDLQNDDASPGRDVVNIGTNANVVLVGTGSATIKVSQNVFVNAGGGLTTANGNLLVEANQQGTPTSGNFAGVRLNGLNAMFRVTGSGLLTVKGKGGNTGNDTEGIYLMSGGKILGGTNTVTLEGIGGPTSGFRSYGVLSGTPSEMSSTGGNIVINGTGDGTGVNSFGIGLGYNGVYAGGTISAGGQGNITITGRGSLNYTEEGSVGIDMRALVTTAGGNITFNGYGGGSGNARFCTGISIFATVSPGGMGTLTLYGEGGIGTGTSNYGVYVARLITSNGGNISITGKEGGSSTSFGVVVGNTDINGLNGEINTVTNGGDITVIANSVASTTDNQALIRCHPSNKVTFLPLTNGVGVNFVATTDVVGGPIAISDFEFDNIIGEAIYLGDANTGVINVNEAITHAAGNVYLNTGQALNLNQSFGAGTGNIAINAAGGINPKSTTVDLSGNAISFTSGNNLNIAIGGTTVNTEYDQLNIQGAIDLRGLNLVLSGSYVPVAGNTFTIVNNDGTDAIVGMFNGLTQGATIPDFRGSGLNATISYTGGTDNNDVVITVEAPAAPNINIKGNGLTIDNGDTSPRTEDGTDFGNVDIHSTEPVVRTFTIENTGTADLVIPASGITKSGDGDFGIGTVLLPLTIAAGSSATFPVIIDASGNGRRTATISIQSNDSDTSPYTFDVTAVGVSPEINVTGLGQDILSGDTTPSTLDDTDFGSVDVNSGVESHTFTIQNTGGTGGDLYINTGAITIFGTHADDFSISGITLPATVSPGQSVTFVVNFNPSAIGTRTASIRIANNDLGESQYRFDVQGTGITADYTITTSGNNLIITDVTGTGETLDISQSNSDIRFDVTGKTFSLNNGLATNFPADVPLSNAQSIMVNTEGGNDIINVGAFTTQLPSLTINGGTGDDQVNMNGDITFVANANLDLDLQNDDANPGVDVIVLNTDANLNLSGTGEITLKSSKNIETKSGSSLAAVAGNILIEANQQTTPTVGSFTGIAHQGTISILGGSGGVGAVTLKGKGGNGADMPQVGVLIAGNVTGLVGSLTIEGTGGVSPANGNVGIHINAPISSKSLITLIGTGNGLGASTDNAGVLVSNTITNIPNTVKGIVITGTGANTTGTGNHGISSNSDFTNTNGAITLTGTAGNTASDDLFINSGTLRSSNNPNNATNINLVGNKVTIGSAAVIGTNLASVVNLLPRTDNTPINLGTETAGSLSYTSDEMNRIFADEIYIGNATTGPITISAPIAPANISATCRITLQSSSDLTISGGGITTLGGNVRFRATNIYPTFSGMDVSMGTTGVLSNGTNNTYVFDINGPAANTGYTQLQVAGKLSLLQTRLTLTGSYTPTLGETFMIINNAGTDPIDNVFVDYAEGYIFNNFLGSGQKAKITYVGGDGNDVILTVVAAPIFTDSPDNQVVCAGNSASFTVASSNAASYKWQARSNSGSSWGNLTNVSPYSNVTTSTLSISDVTGLNNYEYRCVATNEVGNTSSTPATLTVTPLPNATISYSGSPFAQNVAPVSVNRTGTAGGGYTASPTGLTIDGQTGQITPSSSLINNYVVTYTIAASGGCTQFTTTASVEIVAAPAPDYTITTTDGTIVITDLTGTGETLNISQNSGNIRFNVTGKTYRIDGGITTPFPADIALAGKTSIMVNTALGDDVINVGAFSSLPSLTINGGTGDDQVNLNGDITFAANANLDLDLQNDDVLPGTDALTIATNANLTLSGTGTATVKVSKNITMNAGSSLVTQNGNIDLITNSIDIQSGATVSTGTASSVTLRPYTDGVSVDLGAVTDPLGGPLNLTDAELDRITTGTINVGNANSGAITVSAAISRTATTAMNLTSGGALNFNASSLNLNGGNLNINAAGGINPMASGDDINVGTASFTSGNDLNIVINGPTVDTDYRQLKIGGSMSLTGVDLVLTTSNGFVPTIGQTFTIAQRNNFPGAITGRFNGLEYGALITNFLGSGLNAFITYAQTTVVLTVIANTPDYTITTANGQMIITDISGNGEALAMTENGTNIHIENSNFGRTFSLNGAPVAVFPADIPMGGITDITINAGNGNDAIFVYSFTQLFPSLTVNGDAGNDYITIGDLHFAPDAHLNIDLQNDPGAPGEDEIGFSSLPVVLSGSGTAILKASASVYLANLTTENGDIVIEVNQQAVPLAAATGLLMQDNTVQITGTGALIIKATRGQTDGPAIQTFGSSVLSTNSGNLTIEGYAGNGTGSGNRGIEIKAQISSVNGNIFIKGVGGGSGSSADNQGIFLNNIAGGIKTTGSGSITLIGTGGNTTGSANEGIYINSPFIESAAGDVSLTGYSNANSTPVAVNNTPVRTLTAGKTIQINADDISYAGTISTTGTTGSVTLKPTTAGRAVTLGTNVANTLHLSPAELGAISTYRLNIGDANSGAITNNANQALSTISNSVALTTGGALNLNASSFGIGSANLLINAAGGINPTAAGTDATVGTASFTSGNDLNIVINGTTADTDYRQLNVVGSVNLTGLDLVLTGSYTPVIGQTFIIINNDGNDAVIGTFNGLPEGTLIPNFLGSGQNATISYTGGDGNDVVVGLGAPIFTTHPNSLTLCSGSEATFTAEASNAAGYQWQVNTGSGFVNLSNGGIYSGVTTTTFTISNVAGLNSYQFRLVATGSGASTNSNPATLTVVSKPTVNLTVNGQTLSEGNTQTLCDTDANPVNGLQFTVLNSCVVGTPVWRVQVGNGAWSSWGDQAPTTQPSDNQTYRYQAACDVNCISTYSGVIELKINYRASAPQNVSLVADGTTVAAGEEKTICNIEGNAITFNATCAAGEILLYSMDGGDYSNVIPSQIADGNFHNYRVRCRKADGTVSCTETESGVIRLKISTINATPTASLTVTSGCGTPISFAGATTCESFTTIWYNAATNAALPNLPTVTPNETTSYYARCQNDAGCLSAVSNTVTFTVTPVNNAPTITASAEVVCTGTQVTISANCPAGSTAFWNTGVTTNSFQVAFSNVTTQTYWAKCIFDNGCQSPESARKSILWKAFELTFINIGQSQSAIKPANDRNLWAAQFINRDAGPILENSTEANPTIYFSENVNKTAPRYWTIQTETCALGSDGSVTYDLLAAPEVGVPQSFNTHENNAPYLMYANREGFTELYAQNHPAYGFYQSNGSGGNTYDTGLPKGLYKLGIRYWDQKGQGSIYPSTRQPAGNVLAYQEYWFRIQSQSGIGAGSARIAAENGERTTDNGLFASVMPNPVSHTLHLKVNEAKGQNINVNLVDASGRTILQRDFVPITNQHQEEFEVSQLANGLYFLKVNTADKQTTLKVVKVQ